MPRDPLVVASQNLDLDTDRGKGLDGCRSVAFWWVDKEGETGKCEPGLVANDGILVGAAHHAGRHAQDAIAVLAEPFEHLQQIAPFAIVERPSRAVGCLVLHR